MTRPEQFVIVDDMTFRVDFDRKSRLTMPTLGLPQLNMLNSELIRRNATPEDPWGLEWSKTNPAGGGAYKVIKRTSDQIDFVRHEGWKSGPEPKTERVIWRIVPSAGSRRALLERGDADISNDFPPNDIAQMMKEGKLSVVATPMDAAAQFISMNVKMAPFDNVKVRQAIAYAIPYQKILDVVLYGKARLLAGGPAKVVSAEWPQPSPYAYDLAKARQLLAEAGYQNGFETTFSFDAGSAGILEPMCILIQESLGQVGIKVTLEKIAGANWRSAFTSRKLPFLTNVFAAFLEDQSYYFDYTLGKSSIFNSMDYENAEMAKLIEAAGAEDDQAKFDDMIKRVIQIAYDDVPSIPIYQPYQYVAMQKRLTGFRYWFHRQIDYRTLRKA
jgi:peptide/nickel transport system substrate-binding protein